ncbi:MAG: DUF456 domain-containing protein [Anaerolineales bacterium]|nr:DUF456 domain-containing protein [Anaerolineales bacterium]
MPAWLESVITGFTILTMLVGLFGLIVPIFPGNVVIWLAALIYGVVTSFNTLGWWMFGLITILMIIAVFADNVLMGAKARAHGAAWYTIFLALLGGVIGTFAFPPIGGVIASPVILFGLEYLRLKDQEQAFRITRGLIFGWGLSFLVRFGLGLVMVTLWAIWAFT